MELHRTGASRPSRLRRLLAAAPVALLLTGMAGATAGASSTARSGPADDRFDDITGPMGAFVVKPDAFGMDASKTLVDVAPLLASIDQSRAQSLVQSLAFPRTSGGPAQARQDAIDLVTEAFVDAGYTPSTQSVILESTGNDMPNIYAEIPGTQCSNKVLVVGAHYDSANPQGPGADDNASGVGGLMEIARALHDHPLPITVRLVAFSYEEDGLVGAFEMAKQDKAAGTDIVGAVSVEMIGYTTDAIDPLTGLPGTYLAMVTDPNSAPLARAFAAAAYTYTPSFPAFSAVIDPSVLPDIYRSDHAAFALNGYMGLMATDTANFRNPNYHQVTDTLDTLNWNFLADSARTVLAGVVTYASSDQNSDGTADLCAPPAPPTTTTPTTVITTPPPAPVAQAVGGDARYTG